MVDMYNGNDFVYFAAQSQMATLDLKFRFSRQQLPRNNWQSIDDWKHESATVKFLTVRLSNLPVHQSVIAFQGSKVPKGFADSTRSYHLSGK
jgi:hypothetical protein